MLEKPPSRQIPSRPRPTGIFIRSRLCIYGLALITLYIFFLQGLYRTGHWILDQDGTPMLTDFTPMWLAGREALHGNAAVVYHFKQFAAVQAALVGPQKYFFPWPYPPIYFLITAPMASLPYAEAFLAWQALTLGWCLLVGVMIVGDPTAALLIFACPMTLLNVYLGQNGFLTAALIGTALLLLDRRPLLAGLLIGSLSYKPQFAVVLPLVLAASGRWRALASAAATTAALAATSFLAFGAAAWRAFPISLLKRADTALIGHQLFWGKIQSVYGLCRSLGIGAVAAGSAHAAVAVAALVVTCALWRSRASYELKAAAVAAATFLVSPYLFAYDLAAIVVPAAYLVQDQVKRGSLPGERVALLLLFAGLGAMLLTYGNRAFGPIITLGVFGLILRRSRAEGFGLRWSPQP